MISRKSIHTDSGDLWALLVAISPQVIPVDIFDIVDIVDNFFHAVSLKGLKSLEWLCVQSSTGLLNDSFRHGK